jgi:hypothetical protein
MNGIWRKLAIVAGMALIAVGIPLFLTPFPGGLAAIVAGAAIVLASSRKAQRFIRAERKQHPKLDDRLDRIEKKMPSAARKPLEKTHPDRE